MKRRPLHIWSIASVARFALWLTLVTGRKLVDY